MLKIFAEVYPNNSLLDDHTYYEKKLRTENSKVFEKYFNEKIFKKLKTGNHLVVIVQKDFMPYNSNTFSYILSNNQIYRKQPMLFLKTYKSTIEIIKNSNRLLNIKKVYTVGNWIIIVYEKKTNKKLTS